MICAYLRVSGRGQVEGDGFRRQLAACETYAASAGIDIDRVYQEDVTGKTDVTDRQVFSEMLLESPSLVLVEGQHRLARDLVMQEVSLEKCREAGVQVVSAETGTDLTANSDPTGTLIRQILGCVAQWERGMIEAKLRAAREAIRREKGRCEGAKPYANGPIIERMQLDRAVGRTLQQIADDLNADGIPAPKGGMWKKQTVSKIMRRVERDGVPLTVA